MRECYPRGAFQSLLCPVCRATVEERIEPAEEEITVEGERVGGKRRSRGGGKGAVKRVEEKVSPIIFLIFR